MTGPVLLTRVETSFERKARAPGGKKIADSVADAAKALEGLRASNEALIREGMAELQDMVREPRRPTDETLVRVHALADGLLGLCVCQAHRPVAAILKKICELADALLEGGRWARGSFGPALSSLALALEDGDSVYITVLLAQLEHQVRSQTAQEGAKSKTATTVLI